MLAYGHYLNESQQDSFDIHNERVVLYNLDASSV